MLKLFVVTLTLTIALARPSQDEILREYRTLGYANSYGDYDSTYGGGYSRQDLFVGFDQSGFEGSYNSGYSDGYNSEYEGYN